MTVVVLSKPVLGTVSPDMTDFGGQMLDTFLHTMEREELRPQAICLYTEGVRLACEGSPVLLGLELLSGLGVKVLLCGTCVEKFGLSDKVKVGEISTMLDIVTCLNSAERILYP